MPASPSKNGAPKKGNGPPPGFVPAPPEVEAMVRRVVDLYGKTDLQVLVGAKVLLMAREKADEVETEVHSVAAVGVPTTPEQAAQFDYIMWIALDVWGTLDESEREALVFHELMHCDRDEGGKPSMRTHDAAVFNREVELYGLWWKKPQQIFDERN